jgi:hypothetical protein
MKKLVATVIASSAVVLMFACTESVHSEERTDMTSDALGEAACATAPISANGSTNVFGQSYDQVHIDCSRAPGTTVDVEYDGPGWYPGTASCPAQVVLELTNSSAIPGTSYLVTPQSSPGTQEDCEATHAAMTVWTQAGDGTWSGSQSIDVAGRWYPASKSCTVLAMDGTLDGWQAKTIRLVGAIYSKATDKGKPFNLPLPARLQIVNSCIG